MAIRIVQGDIFDSDTHIVVGMTTTFDTETPQIIATDSVQSQLVSRVYGGDRARFDADLERALLRTAPAGTIDKAGKNVVYPVGTTVAVRRDHRFVFCLGFSTMNQGNNARATVDDLWVSLTRLWTEVGAVANGEPTAVPVMGGGQSRLSHVLPAQDAVRLIALSFMLASRRERVCERLDIVIQKRHSKSFNMPELQSFLKAMLVA